MATRQIFQRKILSSPYCSRSLANNGKRISSNHGSNHKLAAFSTLRNDTNCGDNFHANKNHISRVLSAALMLTGSALAFVKNNNEIVSNEALSASVTFEISSSVMFTE